MNILKNIFRKKKTKIFDRSEFNKEEEFHDFINTLMSIEGGTHPEWNRCDSANGSAWYEDESGEKWSSKSEMRAQKLKDIGI